eukprot:TRINITY_DN2749_c0_g2_i1.p1 TRINITY_DN2749_c0_g2~~TRINITY_DN2749_c0_g2_i1.p1  ORF type:complete len:619 (+),score=232.45 TRINITY_DN2749_c0_g2_i1:34-1890(+)
MSDDDDYGFDDDELTDDGDDDDYEIDDYQPEYEEYQATVQNFNETSLLQLEVQYMRQKGYRAGYLVSELYGVTAMVGFPVSDLCSDLILRAAGLHKDLHVVVSLAFPSSPPQYLAQCPGPGRVTVRQSSDTCLDNKQTLADAKEFGLWWTLEQRLLEYLQDKWEPLQQRCLAEIAEAQARDSEAPWNEVMNVLNLAGETGVQMDLRLATFLVKRSAGRFDSIQECLFDEDWMNKLREQAQSAKLYFDDPNWGSFSILNRLVDLLKERIRTCTERCIVCDKPHPLPLLKPVACDDTLCNYQMANLGLGVNLENEILWNPQVVDMLICCAKAAASQAVTTEASRGGGAAAQRRTTFPVEDVNEVKMELKKCPRVEDMANMIRRGEKLQDHLGPKLYKLVRWIIASNTSDIQPVPKEAKVKDMPDYQFLLNNSTPQAEAKFQELKRKHGGSFFAFHGSGLGNWHNILRGGLKKLDLRTAYGPGIYLATNASTSLGYMTAAPSYPGSDIGKQLRIMALCEVIAEGSEKECGGIVHRPKCACNKASPHVRVEAEEYVVTRVLFIFNDSSTAHNNVEAKTIRIPQVDRIGKSLVVQEQLAKKEEEARSQSPSESLTSRFGKKKK